MEREMRKILAWLGLFLNIFFLPGSGTILGGLFAGAAYYLIGAVQLALYVAIIIIDVIYFGNMRVMMIALVPGILIWVWAMVTSILLIRKLKTDKH
ncbi:MAG: hypothetical protein KJ709_02710 [Nanoarchaeota archaeon]|nr:hypothetical protein [Nanoarchaeota archaeon]